jgi:bacillopeptidase F
VAEIGTGVDTAHPDLKGKVKTMVELWGLGNPRPFTGPIVEMNGYSTGASGLICGTHVGVAPGAKLVSGVVFSPGSISTSNWSLAKGIDWACQQPDVSILLLSVGLSAPDPLLDQVIGDVQQLGILPVVAVPTAPLPNGNAIPLLVGTATRDRKVRRYGGSGLASRKRGRSPLGVVAPGENVVSCSRGGGYEAYNGAGFAAAIVAGVAALILEKHPDLTLDELKRAIFSTCKDLGHPAPRQGYGLVQVKAAL